MRSLFPPLPIAAAMAALMLPGAAAAQDDKHGTFTVQIENDYFARTDRHYTQGLRLSYLFPAHKTPAWFRTLPQAPSLIRHGEWSRVGQRIGVAVGQSIFTPQDTDTAAPILTDRPYAGWLYAGASLQTEYKLGNWRRLDVAALEIGVVGPSAKAEEVQNGFHELIRSNEVNGWDNQLKDEPAFSIILERKWKTPKLILIGRGKVLDLGMDFIPHAGVSLGTVQTHGALGATVRLGNHLPGDFGPPRIRPSSPGSQAFGSDGDGRPFRWYLFAGFEARAVARNIFLDGNTFRDSQSVRKKPLVIDVQAGLATVIYDKVRVTYTYIVRSPEFDGQAGPDRFAAISLSVRF